MKRVAVLASGRGSNFAALLDAKARGGLPNAELVLLVSNVPGAGALAIASARGIPASVIDHKGFASRADFDAALVAALRAQQVDYVVLAGFMRLLSPVFIDAYPNRVLNVHPSLLPAFPGAHAARDALAYGAKLTGCTVHFVDHGTDTGPIIAQRSVAIVPGDDEASLQARIQTVEHGLLPEALDHVTSGRVAVHGRVTTLA